MNTIPIQHSPPPDRRRLIAAAPELLEVLRDVEVIMTFVPLRSDMQEYIDVLKRVRAAIAKAEGRE